MVYVARAGEFVPDRMVEDPYVKRSELMAATDVLEMPIPPGERMFLRAALKSGDTA